MDCPRCQSPLKKDVVQELHSAVPHHTCEQCEGIWISPKELSTLEKVTDIQLVEIKKIPSKKEQKKALYCPTHTDTVMDKYKHPKDSAVIYDQCPTCDGIWLDPGELKAIQEEDIGKITGNVILWFFGFK